MDNTQSNQLFIDTVLDLAKMCNIQVMVMACKPGESKGFVVSNAPLDNIGESIYNAIVEVLEAKDIKDNDLSECMSTILNIATSLGRTFSPLGRKIITEILDIVPNNEN